MRNDNQNSVLTIALAALSGVLLVTVGMLTTLLVRKPSAPRKHPDDEE
jgi:hypothetical protein